MGRTFGEDALMTPRRTALVLGLIGLGVLVSARLTLRAQEPKPDEVGRGERTPEPLSIQDALLRPFPLPFNNPTRLDEVCRHLGRVLRAPVVLDKAAIDRQELKPEDTVQLELEGVRLKTGLKLLLDQVGLTYRVIPEDNLLIVTDQQGAEDPLERVQAELKAIHRDIHDIQDALDYLREDLGLEEGGPKVRKPTIIEEMPGEKEKGDQDPKEKAQDPGPRSGASSRSRPGA
jgi:hypothetical protein